MKRSILCLLVALAMLVTCLPAALAEEAPTKITVAGYMFGPIDNELDVITPAVEKILNERYGLNVDIEVVYIEYSEYSEILNPRLAAGTAPGSERHHPGGVLQPGRHRQLGRGFLQGERP